MRVRNDQGFTQQVTEPVSNPGLPPEASFSLLVQLPPCRIFRFHHIESGPGRKGLALPESHQPPFTQLNFTISQEQGLGRWGGGHLGCEACSFLDLSVSAFSSIKQGYQDHPNPQGFLED